MAKIYTSISQLIGNTPLMELVNYNKFSGSRARILGKLEYFNPSSSVKDRVARAMIDDAFDSGVLVGGSMIVEPTSGNTGIGLAMLAAAYGYKISLIMPDTMSKERVRLLEALGATVILSEGSKGMQGAIEMAEDLRQAAPNAVVLGQFTNPSNPKAHRQTTGVEIWDDTDGNVDYLVCGVGTGGTIMGTGEYLKEKNPSIKVVAVEPQGSPVLSQGRAGKHGLQGIGAGFVPDILDTDIIDEVVTVTEEEAFATARALARDEGVLVGISSGAALFAATKIAQRSENEGKTIVVILPDGGERYLSTELFK